MSDELRLGTLGDEILDTGEASLQGDGMTVPIPLQGANDDLPLPPPPFLSAGDDLPQPPIPFGADLPILGSGITIPIP